MVKSRAEICRDYRRRLKDRDNEGYLKKERERRRQNYVPSGLLPKSEKTARQRKNKAAVAACRARKKLIQQQLNNTLDSDTMNTSGYESVASSLNANNSNNEQLIVAMSFPGRAAGPRKRLARDLYRTRRELKDLRLKHEEITRKLKSEQKRKQRILKRLQRSPRTPNSKADATMKKANLSEVQKRMVRKELVFNNTIAEQIRRKRIESNKQNVHAVHQIVAGKIIRKYRCQQALCYRSGLNKNTLSKYSKAQKMEKKTPFMRKFEKKILDFFIRDDNSRVQPGKADVTKSEGVIRQTRVLTDYLKNLHHKFLAENPDCQVSLATFCRVRPKYVRLSAFITRDSCLCTRHQNMALTTKTLRNEGVLVSANPEDFIKDVQMTSIRDTVTSDTISVPQWKRVTVEERGKQKQVMRIVSSPMNRDVFIEHVESQANDFKEHVDRVKRQYGENRRLKQNLNTRSAIIQMDFAENYQCKSTDEIQSAYWNKTSVTLHPVVVYYNAEADQKHKCFVLVSDTMLHSSGTVLSFLDAIIPEVKLLVPDLDMCHYWTDSPTSQYRNKLMFDTIAHHTELYGCRAVWNYFEAGHGKGPCDGLGGTVKRMADNAINVGKAVIQNASDFYAWAISSSLTNVIFKYVADITVAEKVSALVETTEKLKPVKGTMKIHAVFGTGDSTVLVRNTSCYCDRCLEQPGSCGDEWRKENTRKELKKATSKSVGPTQVPVSVQPEIGNADDASILDGIAIGDYVAAKYDDSWYVGKVLKIDLVDGDAFISFMEQRKKLFQWPRKQDELSVDEKDILCRVQPPVPTGKTKRMFKLSDEDRTTVQLIFDSHSAEVK